MYVSHFNLAEEPFSITSDPRFLWMSPHHEEAYAHLLYAIQQRRGFAALTGDIGTGKTTLINSILDHLGDSVRTAVVYNASLDTDELLRYIFRDFGLPARTRTRSEAVIELNDWLVQQAIDNGNSVIVVDEAQNLRIQTLEDLRLLSNMETASRKLLQILLVGQPELNTKLASPELAQLQQRIAIRYHLRPFQITETREYVRHRFRVAGGDPSRVFVMEALDLLHAAAGGVPRVINQICDTALLKAYSRGRILIDASFLTEVLTEDFPFRPLPPGLLRPIQETLPEAHPASPAGFTGSRHSTPIDSLKEPAKQSHLGRHLALGTMLVVAVVAAFALGGKQRRPSASGTAPETTSLSHQLEQTRSELSKLKAEIVQRDSLAQVISGRIDSIRLAQMKPTAKLEPRQSDLLLATRVEPMDTTGWVKLRIRRDDTLMRIVMDYYGTTDWRLVEQILKANPFITNPNTIRIGDEVALPPRPKAAE